MEINDTTIHIYSMCRWFGLAPYTIKRNKLNKKIIDFKLNRPLCIYSCLLLIFMLFFTEYAIIYDLHAGRSIRSRSNSAMEGFVYFMDLNVLVASVLINGIKSMRSLLNTRRVNSLLNQVGFVTVIVILF